MTPLDLLEATVTIRVADLYDFLMGRQLPFEKELPMPEFENATTTKRAKRGFRRVTLTVRSSDYAFLSKMADEESRTPDQQASYLLRLKLEEVNDGRLNAEEVTEAE